MAYDLVQKDDSSNSNASNGTTSDNNTNNATMNSEINSDNTSNNNITNDIKSSGNKDESFIVNPNISNESISNKDTTNTNETQKENDDRVQDFEPRQEDESLQVKSNNKENISNSEEKSNADQYIGNKYIQAELNKNDNGNVSSRESLEPKQKKDINISDDIFFSPENKDESIKLDSENKISNVIEDNNKQKDEGIDIDDLIGNEEESVKQLDQTNTRNDIIENNKTINSMDNDTKANNSYDVLDKEKGNNTNVNATNNNIYLKTKNKSRGGFLRISVFVLILGGLVFAGWYFIRTMFPLGIFVGDIYDDIYNMIINGGDIVIQEDINDSLNEVITNTGEMSNQTGTSQENLSGDDSMTNTGDEMTNVQENPSKLDNNTNSQSIQDIVSKYNNISDMYFRMGREQQNPSMIRYALFVGKINDSIVKKLESQNLDQKIIDSYFMGLDNYLKSVEESVKNNNVNRDAIELFLNNYEDILINAIGQESWDEEKAKEFAREVGEKSVEFISGYINQNDIQNQQVQQFLNQYEQIIQEATR